MKPIILAFFLLLFCCTSQAQPDSANMVKYTPEYKFNDGLYLNFKMVRNNNPIPKARIVSNVAPTDFDFFKSLTEEEKFYLYDNLGVKKEFKTSNIWGYASNGVLYINFNSMFNRIPVIGSIGHFVSYKTVYNNPTYDPYSYGYDPYRTYSRTPTTSTEMFQYIIDFKSGEVREFNRESLLVLLMADPELYDEYNDLRAKKQRKLMFYYLRQFNERNAIYFPVTSNQ